MHLPSPSCLVVSIPRLSQQTEDAEAGKRLSCWAHVWKLLKGDMAGSNCHHVLTPELMSRIPPEWLYQVRQETPLGQLACSRGLPLTMHFYPSPYTSTGKIHYQPASGCLTAPSQKTEPSQPG